MKSLKSLLTLTSLALAVSGSALATNTSVLPTKEDSCKRIQNQWLKAQKADNEKCSK